MFFDVFSEFVIGFGARIKKNLYIKDDIEK